MHYAIVFLSCITTIVEVTRIFLAILEGELVLKFRVCQAPKSLKVMMPCY